ncbi:hypothetical protein HY338_03705 [Candidatus Gottesmanbacteria bacterium]|nr:hypothetical protein [Candidatus Gottesmanbacteria bacterium]
MVKKNINLLIEKELDSALIAKLKFFLPITAGLSFFLFIILFIISISYTKSNLSQYNLIKDEVNRLESKIDEKKNLEGVYTLSYVILKTISEILNNKVTFMPIFNEVGKINSNHLSITQASSDEKGKVSLAIIASSSADLNDLVSFLHEKEDKDKIFSNMIANGIVKNKSGGFELSVSLKADDSLYHEKTN